MRELWDIKRVAAYLGVSERTVYDRVRSGELPAHRVGRLWRVDPRALDEWLSAGNAARPAQRAPDRAPSRADLEAALDGVEDALKRRLVLIGVLSAAVQAHGWSPPVIVGGNAVEFYTMGGYATADIDLVSATEPLAIVLGEWGFGRVGRHWIDETLGLMVEAPGGQLEPGQQARVLEVEIAGYVACVLGIEDLIVDRLSACVHWGDEESCRWGERLVRIRPDRLDVTALRERADAEDVRAQLEDLLRKVGT